MEVYKQTRFMLQRDQVYPGYNAWYDGEMESASDSDFDSDETLELPPENDDIDVNGFLGRAVAIWLYHRLDNLAVFTPRPDDTLTQISQYIEARFGFDHGAEKIMVLEPGEKIPTEFRDVFGLKPGSVIMVMPKKNITTVVEINQLNQKFPVSADPLATVFEVKSYIKRVKGIPIDQMDILYRDRVLENCRRLYEYKVKSGTTMHVLIQVHFDVLVTIDTFWGKTYKLYVDKCTTSSDIMFRIFSRTFSHHGKDPVSVHELYVPVQFLIFQHKKRALNWDFCLGYYGVKAGDTLELNTVGRQSNMNMQTLMVITELGEHYEVTVSQFDRWSVVAFILHGHTDVPVDLIRLYRKEVQLAFTSVVGVVPKNALIMMNITMTNVNKDMVFGIPLKISVGNGIVENLKMVPTKTIKDIKLRLEDIGVPNATLFEIGNGHYKLPGHAKIQDVIRDIKKTLFLKVEKYPIFFHAPDKVIYKTMVDVNDSLKNLRYKIELKSGHAISSCRLIMSGQDIDLSDSANLYSNGISTRNSIFVEASPMFDTFFVTSGDLLVKLRIPVKPTWDVIKKSVWGNRDVPEGSITCLQTFFFWFFAPRVGNKYQLNMRRKRRKRLPASSEPLHLLSDRVPTKKKPGSGIVDYSEVARGTGHRQKDRHIDYSEDSDDDVQTQRTWPISLQRQYRPTRNVDDWVNATWSEPRYSKRHMREPTRKQIQYQERRRPEPIPESYIPSRKPRQYITPRWIDNLQQQDKLGQLTADENGLAYRTKPKQGYYPAYPTYQTKRNRNRSKGRATPHQQGDASNARYFNTKRSYDRQDVFNGYESDSENGDIVDERPHIVLR